MMEFNYLAAILRKRSQPDAPPPPRSMTPLANVTQGSRIDISSVPIVLARGKGSLIEMMPSSERVSAIGRLQLPILPSFMPSAANIEFVWLYLEQAPHGTFIHLATKPNEPTILERRLYQPYHQVVPTTPDDWKFWLLDDPDPDIGGVLGCPVMQGRDTDGGIDYQRSWAPSDHRIPPYQTEETVLDIQGHTNVIRHSMMAYKRSLTDDNELSEHMLVSVVETASEACVNFWLGVDINADDLTTLTV